MLKRKIYKTLLEWKQHKKQECLLVKGARQIGKTYIIDYFGKNNYASYIYINFIENPQFAEIFTDTLSAEDIYKRLTLLLPSAKLIPNDTLIFLDEIQICPNARTALKFLAQDGHYDVVASGSLLGINYKEIPSIPVGYETQVTMHGLDFEEYLWALGYDENKIATLRDYFLNLKQIPDVIHKTMMDKLREYAVVGGLPAVVNKFLETKHFGEVFRVQKNILDSYLVDIINYASTTEKPKVRNCYMSIPQQLAKENTKFQFSVVQKKSSARKYENSIEWLRDANLVNLCQNVSVPLFPINAYAKGEQFKAYLSDTGLLSAMYGYDMKLAIIDDSLKGPAKGGFYENLIGDMLVKRGYHLYYYRTQNGEVEIEFLLSKDAQLIPVEVKANRGSTVSLNKILERDDINYGYKLTSGNLGVQGKKRTLPMYMAMFL